ncbi:hypothetical protein HPO96_13065 [Kribbella sandramycini]|uniref:Uncharacterized protein n=1 Tax=Kribbella sandramycini TaxID=60450 RepID=A0A7Y4KYU2_9ACTN|nr:hypothetical protein [Kribbella sandramycini]MBB6568980.1 hypothetical protein [Kribbella sandramycini]NOL41175.1 hypothetical protein [Kribbella sandramycini]
MTDDLGTKFAVLTEDRPEPIDPAAVVRTGITKRRRRRRATGLLATAAGTALAVAAVPVVSSLLRPEPITPAANGSFVTTAATPSPVAKPVPGLKGAYYVAQGKVNGQPWHVIVYPGGCLSSWDLLTRPQRPPRTEQEIQWREQHARALGTGCEKLHGLQGIQSGPNGKDTEILAGKVPLEARTVRVIAARTYTVDAISTPASSTARYYAVAFPKFDPGKTRIEVLDADGRIILKRPGS